MVLVLTNTLVFVVGNHAVGASRFFILVNIGFGGSWPGGFGPGQLAAGHILANIGPFIDSRSVEVRSGGLGRGFGRYGGGGHDGE